MGQYLFKWIKRTFSAGKVFVVLAVAVFAVTAGGYLWAQEETTAEFSDEQIVDYYVEIAFGSEFTFISDAFLPTKIRKRDQNRIIRILALPSPSVLKQEIFEVTNSVVEILNLHSSGTNIQFYKPENVVEFFNRNKQEIQLDYEDSIVVFISLKEELIANIKLEGDLIKATYDSIASAVESGAPLCMGAYAAHDKNAQAIGKTVLWIEYGPQLKECLYEEIMQSFGIGNDFPAGTLSMFNDDGVFDRPTPLDWTLWRIHTDPRIVAGMNEEEVRIVAMEILKEIGE